MGVGLHQFQSSRNQLSYTYTLPGEGWEWVPTIMPSVVSLERSRATARPKSPILAIPSEVSHTLLGFRSRWMIPLE